MSLIKYLDLLYRLKTLGFTLVEQGKDRHYYAYFQEMRVWWHGKKAWIMKGQDLYCFTDSTHALKHVSKYLMEYASEDS